MEYQSIYQSEHREFLEILLEGMHSEGLTTARFRAGSSTTLEVAEHETEQAKEYLESSLDVIMSMIESDPKKKFTPNDELKYLEYLKTGKLPEFKAYVITNKFDLFKYFLAVLFYLWSGLYSLLNEIQGGDWWWLLIFFMPIIGLWVLALKVGPRNLPRPLHPKDEAWLLKAKKITKLGVWAFWVIALLWTYLLISVEEVMWGTILTGNMNSLHLVIDHFAPLIALGSAVYIFKCLVFMRKYFNPKYFSPEEIEKNKRAKLEAIEKAKSLI